MLKLINRSWGILFILIFFFIEIGVYISTLTWIDNMETTKCKCSEGEYRDFIKKTTGLYLGFTTLACIYNIYAILYKPVSCGKPPYILQIPFTIIWFVNVIFSIIYIDNLKKQKCKCSEDFNREIFYVYNWIRIGIIIIYAFSLFIYMSLYGYNKYF